MVYCVMQPMPNALYDLPEIEYLDGRPHAKVSPRLDHSVVQGALIRIIGLKGEGRGLVLPELRVDPGTRGALKTEFVPDVSFISYERLSQLSGEARQEPPFSPDIAIEVRSPSDNLRYLARKIARYLETGAPLVLDVDPATRSISAHASDGVRTFSTGERFAHNAVPWLEFDVDCIFVHLDIK